MRWVIAAGIVVAGGCGAHASTSAADDDPQTAVVEPEPAPEAEPEPATPPPVVSWAGALEIQPAEAGGGRLPHDPATSTGRHAAAFGWAADGESFALCLEGGGAPRECTVTFIDGKAETLSDGDTRLRAGGYAKGSLQWAHGKGVKLTWSAPEGKKRLVIGARLDTGERVDELVWMDFDPSLGDEVEIYPEVIAISPDGDRIAVVGHAVASARHEFETILLHSDDFAARAYAQAGFDHLGEERFERAVAAFERAAAADPNSWERAYDLACARARFGQGNVRRPLSRAIDLGGEKVRTKAQRDSALASVKRTEWFKAMVSQ